MLDLEKELNKEQFEAAKTLEGPVLIIAGAGSGKTRMITYRIAHMLRMGIPQSSILALTFTNKAAREMWERVKQITQKKLSNLTVSTFHAFGVKLLREEIGLLGYKNNFSIYDQTDKIALIKETARELKIATESLDLYNTANLFSSIKTERIPWSRENAELRPLYNEYQEHLKIYNAVDFDDLIILPIFILEKYPDILGKYRARYRYIMVDEFQDTSLIQYKMMRLLGEESRNVCVVGDDDQSIYSWRGANYQNLLMFEKDFPERKEIKLEQNYRSTKNILAAANSLISNNKNRKTKELWTGIEGGGTSISLFYPENEQKEGEFIAEMIRSIKIREKVPYHDFGVLFRTNSLTTSLEEALLSHNIPYKVSGGTSFFQRKEIKDIISYLRVLANPEDDVNLLRIINTPRRGFGKKALEYLRALAESKKCSLYSAMSTLRWASDSGIAEKIRRDVEDFLSLLDFYREKVLHPKGLSEAVKGLIDAIDYWGYLILEHQKNEKIARWKYGNLVKFIEIIRRWEEDPDNDDPSLFSYLNRITLITREEDSEEEESKGGKVNLMTIHSAKGLEFDILFLAGVEAHLIPHAKSLEENPDNLEEERRLFYVAITRAKKRIHMTCCRTRKGIRGSIECQPSPFLEEIPAGLMELQQEEKTVEPEEAADYFASLRKAVSKP